MPADFTFDDGSYANGLKAKCGIVLSWEVAHETNDCHPKQSHEIRSNEDKYFANHHERDLSKQRLLAVEHLREGLKGFEFWAVLFGSINRY